MTKNETAGDALSRLKGMKRIRRWMLWPARFLIYSLAAWLGLWVIFPAVGGGVWGMVLAAPTAAAAIGLDIFLSARVMGRSGEHEAIQRIATIDRALSGKEIPPHRREIEVEAEEITELPQPEDSSSKRISPPSER